MSSDRSRRWRMAVAAATVATGMVVSGVLVLQASQAAFSDTTANSGNNWRTGTVALSNNRGSAMFDTSAQPIKPNDVHQRCIQVTYGGDVAAAVRVYSANLTDTGVAPDIHLTIEEGTGGVFGGAECTTVSGFTADVGGPAFDGTLDAFAAKAAYAQGVGVWQPAAAGSKVYRFTYELVSSAVAAQGKQAQLDFVWEVQNT